jgi:hypothetical protein
MATRPPGMRGKLPVQKKGTVSSAKRDDVASTSTSDPFVFPDQEAIAPDPPTVVKVVLSPPSASKHLTLKQPKKSPLSGTKVRLSPHSPSKHRNLQESLKSPSSGTKVDAPGTNLEVDVASGNAVAVKTEGVLSMKTRSSARGENVRDTEDVVVNKRHGVKTSKKKAAPPAARNQTKPTISISAEDTKPTKTKPTISISAEERAEETSNEVADTPETEPTQTIVIAEPTVTQPTETKPTISISAEETAEETSNEVVDVPETEPTQTIVIAEPTVTQPTETKPTISISAIEMAEETSNEVAEPPETEPTKTIAADTNEPDWLTSMTADTLFHSDSDIESMDLHVSEDSEDSVISVERVIVTNQGEPVALVYPFVGGLDIEKACMGLFLGEENTRFSPSHILMLQQEKVAPRSHFVTMHQSDFARLNPNQYLNDSLVDFWLLWISRKEANEEPHIMFFNTQLYSTILLAGASCVINWNEKRGVDIFTKRILVIPVNKDNHWSLCAVYNAGQIAKVDKKDRESVDIPFIMFLDPLDYHSRGQVCQNIRDWLNAEWNNKYKKSVKLFTDFTITSVCPAGKQILLFDMLFLNEEHYTK